jgi:uncharacterized membrane protein
MGRMASPRQQDAQDDAVISRAQAAWLQAQTSKWVNAGLMDAGAREKILSLYRSESAERHGMLALILLGALMFGIGVLLLIGYNWTRIPINGKVAMLLGSVALAFGASAAGFAKRRPVVGETLAAIGVLLFGNAIWLIAQVLHIRGNFADGFLWWAVGALASAALVRSRAIGVGAAVLVGVWVLAAGHTVERPVALFLVIWASTVLLAYRLPSPIMIRVAAFTAAAWVAWIPDRLQSASVSVGAAALMGCAFHAAGSWHRASSVMGRAWQTAGLTILVLAFLPLLMTHMHDGSEVFDVRWASLRIVPVLLLAALSPLLRGIASRTGQEAPRSYAADWTVIVTAVALAAWMALMAAGFTGRPAWTRSVTIGFSVLALALSVSLIRKALRTDTTGNLVFGVFFALAFLLVRWASLIDSMLWSGLMLLVASAGFFAIAKLWRDRERRSASARPAVQRP